MRQIPFILGQKHLINPGMATEQQPVFIILSTDQENNYPRYIKLAVILVDNKKFIKRNNIKIRENKLNRNISWSNKGCITIIFT